MINVRQIPILFLLVLLVGCSGPDNSLSGNIGSIDERATLAIETKADGSGIQVIRTRMHVTDAYNFYLVARDAEGNFLATLSAEWELSGTNVGSLSANNGKSVTVSALNPGDVSLTASFGAESKTADLQVLPRVYSEPESSPGQVSNDTSLNMNVSGNDTVNYYYKVGIGIDCQDSSGYLGPYSTSVALSEDISALGDGTIVLCLLGEDSNGEKQPLEYATKVEWVKDTAPPSDPSGWALSSPSNGSTSNDTSPEVSATGLVGADGGKAQVFSDAGCTSLLGEAVVDAGSFTVNSIVLASDGSDDGSVNFYGILQDAASNPSNCTDLSLSYTLDTQAPTGNSLTIDAGASYTSATAVTLTLASTGADQMYITDESSCASGGSWEAFSTSKAWTLSSTNTTVNVFAKFKDASGNESSCVSDDIVHDTQGPTAPTAVSLGSVPKSLSSTPTLSWSASTDSGTGVSHYQAQVYNAGDDSVHEGWTNLTSGTALSGLSASLVSGNSYYVRVRAVDVANNIGSESTASSTWTAQPPEGQLDTTFNGVGYVTENSAAGGGQADASYKMALDSSGRAILAGTSYHTDGSRALVVWRYNTDGTLDTTFATSGHFIYNQAGSDEYAYGIKIDSNGKIVIAGDSNTGGLLLIRLNSDGSYDSTLGGTGVVTKSGVGVTSLDLDSTGRIIIGGYTGSFYGIVICYESNGTPCSGFASSGQYQFPYSSSSFTRAVVVDASDRIVAAGVGNSDSVVYRLTPSGVLDTTFNGTGYDFHDGAGGASGYEDVYGATIDSNGKIVLVGYGVDTGGGNELVVWRYNSDGSFDTTLNGVGYVGLGGVGSNDVAHSVDEDSSGRLVIAGYQYNSGNMKMALWRILSDGSPDTEFDSDGSTFHDAAGGGVGDDVGRDVKVDSSGRIWVTGVTQGATQDIAVWRYN